MSKVGKLWLLTVPVLVAAGLLFSGKPIEIDPNDWLDFRLIIAVIANDWLDILLVIAVIAFVSLGAAMFLAAIALTGIKLFKPDARILTSSKRIALIIVVLAVLFLVVNLWMAMADIDRLRSHPRLGQTVKPSCNGMVYDAASTGGV